MDFGFGAQVLSREYGSKREVTEGQGVATSGSD